MEVEDAKAFTEKVKAEIHSKDEQALLAGEGRK